MVNCNYSTEKMYLVQHLIALKFFFSSAITCKQNTRFFKIYFQQNSIFIRFKKSTIFLNPQFFVVIVLLEKMFKIEIKERREAQSLEMNILRTVQKVKINKRNIK